MTDSTRPEAAPDDAEVPQSNRDAAIEFAEFGLSERHQGRRESASGPGSSLESTIEVRSLLQSCIEDFSISSILDLGCGDWNWMKHVMQLPVARQLAYFGWDIHPGMISALQREYGSSSVQFRVADIFGEPLPAADLVICRDVLFHVDIGLASRLVSRIMNSGSRFFMSTTFPDEPENANIVEYLPIDGWGFHRINLDIAPFSLRDRRLRQVRESRCAHGDRDRFVCVFEIPPPVS